MKRHRYFIDHCGHLHRAEISREELHERRVFMACFAATMAVAFAVLTLASGIFA